MELTSIFADINPNEIANEIKKSASEAKTEEDLKIRVEHLLRSRIFDKWNIPWAFYEHKTKKISAIKPGRKDALYGRVIIEYEAPGTLESPSHFESAKDQVKKYIEAEAIKKEEYSKYFGVVLDGYSIAFIRFRKGKWEEPVKALDVNEQTISTFLRAIRGLQRKPIDVEYLLLDFGPRSELSKKVILNFYEILLKSKSNRTKMLFEDWKRVFSQVCAYSKDKLIGLIEYYGLQDRSILDVEKLMFAIHTYYTLLMKFLTSEIVSYFNIPYSFLAKLESSYYKSLDELLSELKKLEEGGIIAEIGIRNFLEADYFAWYLDEWNKLTAELIVEIIKRLREYEPATAELEPDRIKDLFKRLYQNLVPKKVRHDLGEYFTPDWLAELLLDETSYDGNIDKRVLDPACGSGTFLVLVIKRIKDYAEQNFITDKKELLLKIINNVVGIDLNPLAVLASRANYIIALGDLIRAVPKEGIEIPVYLADSILVSRGVSVFTGKPEFVLETSVAKFWVREEIIKKNLWEPILNSIEFCLKNDYSVTDFKKYINEMFVEKGFVTKDAYGAIVRLYEQFLKLEKKRLDGIWTKVIKNSFAPMLIGQFDYVVGNPPWVNWNNLPERYRELLKKLFDEYKILPEGPYIPRVDISMLFSYRCMDVYLKKGGTFGFLITQIVFKSFAGSGFLKLRTKNFNIQLIKIHDLVELQPFEGATNRTSLFIAKKDSLTKFPIEYVVWRKGKDLIEQEDSLEEVKNKTIQVKMFAEPIEGYSIQKEMISPLATLPKKEELKKLKSLIAESFYKAHTGVSFKPKGVFLVKILKCLNNDVIIQNIEKAQKIKVSAKENRIEKQLLHPIIKGKDIDKYYVSYDIYGICPYEFKPKFKILDESKFKTKFPFTFQYLNNLKEAIAKRWEQKLVSKSSGYPFYFLFRFNEDVTKNYKVVWKDIADRIYAAVLTPINDNYLGLTIPVPDDTVDYIAVKDLDEAHYLSAILNSSIVDFIIQSYHHLHFRPQVLQRLNIKKFNPENVIHKMLSELSKKAHELANRHHKVNDPKIQKELEKVEEEIDKNVAKLYNISDKELEEMKTTLKMIK